MPAGTQAKCACKRTSKTPTRTHAWSRRRGTRSRVLVVLAIHGMLRQLAMRDPATYLMPPRTSVEGNSNNNTNNSNVLLVALQSKTPILFKHKNQARRERSDSVSNQVG
ncbi:hypothetical protein PoB_000604700 [Plakobranchus ocellatus]|uniref:Uncharacterized protein n=1 Tax=Plakobranchus ocellatus TaxID=259542 RepID=A0AAV3YAV1_9GAST|nr:hypothetical protein PoB_000604700 [Plakobranchus ocellatus]